MQRRWNCCCRWPSVIVRLRSNWNKPYLLWSLLTWLRAHLMSCLAFWYLTPIHPPPVHLTELPLHRTTCPLPPCPQWRWISLNTFWTAEEVYNSIDETDERRFTADPPAGRITRNHCDVPPAETHPWSLFWSLFAPMTSLPSHFAHSRLGDN